MPKESALLRAQSSVRAGLSKRAAARRENVAESTLRWRLRANGVSKLHNSLLTEEEERAVLLGFASNKLHRRDAATRAEVLEKVTEILRASGDHRSPGKNWFARALRRHPEVTRRSEVASHAPEKPPPESNEIELFFDTYEELCRKHGLLNDEAGLRRIWGADEL